MSSSWSNLPLDLLIIIRNKLQRADLLSFRSVCFQWQDASPIPNPCPRYMVDFDNKNNSIKLTSKFNNDISHVIPSPFSSSSPLSFFSCSNGWLIFITHNDETLHLFDPVSNRKLILPPLNPKLIRYYKKIKPKKNNAYHASFWNVVVSSSIDTSIAVAGIVEIRHRNYALYRRLVFCRHAYGDCQRWSFLIEESKDIMDISLAGDGRFYAVFEDCKFCMLVERPPLIKLIKVKLWLPKQVLYPSSDNSPPSAGRVPIIFYGLKASGETNLNIYGCHMADAALGRPWHLYLKLNLADLHGNSNNIEVACDGSWSYDFEYLPNPTSFFTPSITKGTSLNVESNIYELDIF